MEIECTNVLNLFENKLNTLFPNIVREGNTFIIKTGNIRYSHIKYQINNSVYFTIFKTSFTMEVYSKNGWNTFCQSWDNFHIDENFLQNVENFFDNVLKLRLYVLPLQYQ